MPGEADAKCCLPHGQPKTRVRWGWGWVATESVAGLGKTDNLGSGYPPCLPPYVSLYLSVINS